MDPNSVRWWQAIPYAAISVALALACGSQGAIGVVILTLTLGALWLALIVRYKARRLAHVSAERASGDSVMATNAVIALAPGLVVAVLVISTGLASELRPRAAAWTLTLPMLAILASSLLDWYALLPFRDGIEGLPACRVDAVTLTRRRRFTKLWIAHRLMCESLLAGALLASALILIGHYTRNLGVAGEIASVMGAAGIAVGIAWKRWIIGGLRFCLRQGPALGSWSAVR
jgi:hypothetical protein